MTQLAPGVWEIRHADPVPGWVHGNTLVVIGTQAVFVVDACNIAMGCFVEFSSHEAKQR